MPEILVQHRPVLVTVRARMKKPLSSQEEEVDDVFVTYWHTQISENPHLYLIALQLNSQEHKIVEQAGGFVVHFIPSDWQEKIDMIKNHNIHADRIKKAGFAVEEAQNVDAYRISNASGFFECKVERIEESGESVLIIGRVLRSRLM